MLPTASALCACLPPGLQQFSCLLVHCHTAFARNSLHAGVSPTPLLHSRCAAARPPPAAPAHPSHALYRHLYSRQLTSDLSGHAIGAVIIAILGMRLLFDGHWRLSALALSSAVVFCATTAFITYFPRKWLRHRELFYVSLFSIHYSVTASTGELAAGGGRIGGVGRVCVCEHRRRTCC